jgi:hypothetical protein
VISKRGQCSEIMYDKVRISFELFPRSVENIDCFVPEQASCLMHYESDGKDTLQPPCYLMFLSSPDGHWPLTVVCFVSCHS